MKILCGVMVNGIDPVIFPKNRKISIESDYFLGFVYVEIFQLSCGEPIHSL
jgi:hypothetical protein